MNDSEILLANILSLGTRDIWQNCFLAVEGDLRSWSEKIRTVPVNRILIVGCGTSLYAGLVGKYVIERLTHMPVEVSQAFSFSESSEPALLAPNVLVVGISTTGTSTSTCSALDLARRCGAPTLAFTAVPNSEITRIADTTILTGGRVNISVQTETYLQSLICLYLLGLHLADHLGKLSADAERYWLDQLHRAEIVTRAFLDQHQSTMADLASQIAPSEMVVVIGTGANFGTAGEASLKVIEMAKMHSVSQELEEFFHGYDRQLNTDTPVIFIAPHEGRAMDRMLDFLTFTKTVKVPSIVLAGRANPDIQERADRMIVLRGEIDPLATPLINIAPCYLFSYHLAIKRGVDPSARRFPEVLAPTTHYPKGPSR